LPKQRELLLVEWDDHVTCGSTEWLAVKKIADLRPERIFSVGWLMNETGDCLVLAAHGNGDEYFGEICIMKRAIKRRSTIKISAGRGPLSS